MTEFGRMKMSKNIGISDPPIQIESEFSAYNGLGHFIGRKIPDSLGHAEAVLMVLVKTYFTGGRDWQFGKRKKWREWVRENIQNPIINQVISGSLPMINHGKSKFEIVRPDKVSWYCRNIGPQLSPARILSTTYEVFSSQPKKQSSPCEQKLYSMFFPPFPRVVLVIIACIGGWFCIRRGDKYLAMGSCFSGRLLAGCGYLMWGGALLVWFISRFPWSWCLPI